MYNKELGESMNHGQSFVPRQSAQPRQPQDGQNFMAYQDEVYGQPGKKKKRGQPGEPGVAEAPQFYQQPQPMQDDLRTMQGQGQTPPMASTPFMPNGAPQIQPQPLQQQQPPVQQAQPGQSQNITVTPQPQQSARLAPNGQGGGVAGSGVFDKAAYLKMYPDVAASGMDAEDHFNKYGRAEGRQNLRTDIAPPPNGGNNGGAPQAPPPGVPNFNSDAERNEFYSKLDNGSPVAGAPGWQWQHNGQGWAQVQTSGTGGNTPPPPPQTPGVSTSPPASPTFESNDAKNAFYASLNHGDPVAGAPGWSWKHNGAGWEQVQGVAGPAGGLAGNAPTPPTGGLTPYTQTPPQSTAQYTPTQFNPLSPLGPVRGPAGVSTPQSTLPAQTNWWQSQLLGQQTAPGGVTTQPPSGPASGDWWTAQGITTNGPQAPEDVQLDERGVYKPGTMPGGMDYNAQNIDRFTGPQTGGTDTQQQGLIQRLLADPETMNQQQVSRLKGSARDSALAMQQQMLGSTRDNLAARGIDPTTAGYADTLQQSIKSNTTRGLLDSYRDIDTQAVGQNRQDLLAAIGAGETYQSGLYNRALGGFGANLDASDANRNEQMAGIDSRYRNFTTQEDMNARGSDSLRAAIGDQRDQRNFNATRNDSNRRTSMDFLSNQRQSDRDNDFRNRDLGAQNDRFNATQQFNYTDMNNRNSQFNLGFQSDQMQNQRDNDFRDRSMQSETDRFNAGQQWNYDNLNNQNQQFNQTQQTDRDRMMQQDNQFGAQFGADRDRFNQSNYQFGQGQQLDRDRMHMQNTQFNQSYGLDRDRLNSGNQQWDKNFDFQQNQFNYGKEQDALSNQRSIDAQNAAQSRWEEEQLMQQYNQENGNDDELWAWLTGGGQ